MNYCLTNGVVLTGKKDMEPLTGYSVLVEGKKIRSIVPATEPVPEGFSIIDLKGKYLLPGLVDLHVHLAGSGKPKNKSADAKKLVKLIMSCALTRAVGRRIVSSCAKTQLMSGTTTIRSVGGISDFDSCMRDSINSGKLIGPRILAADMAISVPGGHMAGSLAYEAQSPEDAVRYVDILAEKKVDLIKLMITGGVSDAVKVGEPGILRMKPEIVKAACDRAHKLGFKVAAHVESPEGVKVALENGVDSIEHGAEPTDEIIALFKEKKAFQVSTISPALPFALFGKNDLDITDAMRENGKIVFNGIIDMAKKCLENDIPVGLGNDTACPYVTQYDMWRELNYYVKYCNVSTAFALYSATLLNATLAGVGDITGSIEEGKSADMIVVDSNPLENLAALRDVKLVFMEGKKIVPKLKKIQRVEDKLDEYL